MLRHLLPQAAPAQRSKEVNSLRNGDIALNARSMAKTSAAKLSSFGGCPEGGRRPVFQNWELQQTAD